MKKLFVFIMSLIVFFSWSLTACSGSNSVNSIPSNTELIHVSADRAIYQNLSDVEATSSVIVEGVIKENLGQKVKTKYNPGAKKDLPVFGCTRWQVQITKVYKGDVKEGSAITYGQEYYLWDKSNGGKQLLTTSAQKPVSINKKYLFFLTPYDDYYQCYYAAGDYEGKFAVPSDEQIAKAKSGTWTPSDLELYDNDSLLYLDTVYKEVVEKYFDN